VGHKASGRQVPIVTRKTILPVSGKWFSVMVLSVFGDESHDETKQRVFAVSGLFCTEDEWHKAEMAWTDVTRGEVFHAADWEYAGRMDEYKALAQTLAASPVAGIVFAIDLAAFNACYPDTLPEAVYLKCFTKVVIGIARNVAALNERQPDPSVSRLEYTFDNRPNVQFSAARLYDAILSEPGFDPSSLMASKISFECRTNPRIQMADMIAREGMKDLDRIVGPTKFPERQSKVELAKNGHFRFFILGRQDFEQERINAAEWEKDGFTEAAYHDWLRRKNAQDTWDNKVRFQSYFDARRRT